MNKRTAQKIINNQYKKGSKLVPVEFYTKRGINKTELVRISCQAFEAAIKYEAFQIMGVVPMRRP